MLCSINGNVAYPWASPQSVCFRLSHSSGHSASNLVYALATGSCELQAGQWKNMHSKSVKLDISSLYIMQPDSLTKKIKLLGKVVDLMKPNDLFVGFVSEQI